MAGGGRNLIGLQHARPAAEQGFGLFVVEAPIAGHYHQDHALADPQRQSLGDLARRDAMRRRCEAQPSRYWSAVRSR